MAGSIQCSVLQRADGGFFGDGYSSVCILTLVPAVDRLERCLAPSSTSRPHSSCVALCSHGSCSWRLKWTYKYKKKGSISPKRVLIWHLWTVHFWVTPTVCQLFGCLFFTRLRGSCSPSVSAEKVVASNVLGSILSWGKEICWRGCWRDWLDSSSVLQRDRGFDSAAASDIFAWALRGAPSAWPTWKYRYRRAWKHIFSYIFFF